MSRLPSIEPDTVAAVTLDIHGLRLTDEQFYRLCSDNPELRLELTANGELIIMSPAGSKTGWREAKLVQRLANWTERDASGLCFGPSAGFTLPNGAKRSPDAAWMPRGRWDRLNREQQEAFAPICPDFVVELRSPSDSIQALHKKMSEYIQNGATLAWLLDPVDERVYIYRSGGNVEALNHPETLTGEDVLPGFQFNFREIL